MKLRGLTLTGIRGIDTEEIALSPVNLFVGPNGSGKTTIVGAIAYALTGQFPGFVGIRASDLLPLATNPKEGFQVTLVAEDDDHERSDITIERGVHRDGENFLKVSHGAKKSKGIESAKTMLGPLVGEVQWFLDAFNPEKSIWRLSDEKRKEWVLNLCAGASKWTKERLIKEMGGWTPKEGELPDWNPNLAPDAATCVDLNLDKLKDRVLAAQKVVREAKVIVDGVTADPLIEAQLAPTETAYEAARQTALERERLLNQAQDRQAAIDKARRDRELLTRQIAQAQQRIDAFLPPAKPVFDDLEDEVLGTEQLLATLNAIEAELRSAREDHKRAEFSKEFSQREARRILHEIEQIETEGKCFVCDTPNASTAKLIAGRGTALADVERASMDAHRTGRRAAELQTQFDQLQAQIQARHVAEKVRAHDEQAYAERRAQFDSAVGAILTSKASLEGQLERVPADQPDVDLTELDQAAVTAKTEEQRLKQSLNAIRSAIGVVQEQKGQREAQTAAEARVEELKGLLERMRTVRDRMLDDVVAPLRGALKDVDGLAPRGGHWEIRRHGRDLEIGCVMGTDFLPANSLSAGEKYRATVALLVARLMVRREPTALIFCDNLELIYPESERLAVLSGLSQVARAGFVDNILAAAACASPGNLPGIRVVERGVRR